MQEQAQSTISIQSHDQAQFRQEATTFNLIVTKMGENKINIHLQDFNDWVLYEKQYTASDIGGEKEINPRFDLRDLYNAFAKSNQSDGSNLHNSSNKSKDKNKNVMRRSEATIRDYTFSQVIRNKNRDFYKIEAGGRITVYTPGIDSETYEKIHHSSELHLKEVRKMGELEIMSEKLLAEKREHSKKFQLQLDEIKKDKYVLEQKIQNLSSQHKKLLQSYNRSIQQQTRITKQNQKITQQLAQTRELLQACKGQVSKYSGLEQKVSQFKDLCETVRQEARTLVEGVKGEFASIQKANMDEIGKVKEELLGEVARVKAEMLAAINQKGVGLTNLTNNLTAVSNNFEALKTKYSKQSKQTISRTILLSPSQPFVPKFRQYSTLVQYIGQDSTFTQYILNQALQPNTSYTYKFKIVKTASRNIMVGFVDYSRQKDARTSYQSGNAVCYYGLNGTKYGFVEGGIAETGFVEGEVVELKVDMASGEVTVSVAGRNVVGVSNMVREEGRCIMPYLEFYNLGDIVQLIVQ